MVDLDTPQWQDGEPTGFFMLDGDNFIVATGENTYQRTMPVLWLASERIPKQTHNAKAVYHRALRERIAVGGLNFDTDLADYLLHPEAEHDPASIARRYLHVRDLAKDPLQITHALHRCVPKLRELLHEQNLDPLYYDVELYVALALARMEEQGVTLDVPPLEELTHRLTLEANAAAHAMFELAGQEFDIASTKQLPVILYDVLKLPKGRRTKSGYSTDAKHLSQIVDMHPILPLLLQWRKTTKLVNTYAGKLPKVLKNGKLHCQFNQDVCVTGRLSSSDPNLQNIPTRTAEGREIRKAFIPSHPDWILLAADYSQIELRVLAHYSQDETMLNCFRIGEDLHAGTARKLFGLGEEETPTKEQRNLAKIVNFAIPYGTTPHGLSLQIHSTVDVAQDLQQSYLLRFFRVNEYLREQWELGRQQGYVETLMHRRRPLFNIQSLNSRKREESERFAANHPIQGTAADIMKIALVKVDRALSMSTWRANLLLQVHDELVLETHMDDLPYVAKIVKNCMESAFQLSIPLVAELKVGPNWGSMTKWEGI